MKVRSDVQEIRDSEKEIDRVLEGEERERKWEGEEKYIKKDYCKFHGNI